MRATNAADADRFDRATGYPGQTHAASGSSPYVTDSRKYWIASDGLDTIAEGLLGQAQANGADVRLNTRVADVARARSGYTIRLSIRNGHNDFAAEKLHAKVVVVCTPPHAWREWTVARRCRSTLDAVQAASLYHVYASGGTPPKRHTLIATGQRIPSQYDNPWHQAMYSSGRVADFWYRLRLARPQEFAKLLGGRHRIRDHYWQKAFHMWRPSTASTSRER